MDGKYEAKGRIVKRNPTRTRTGFKMGFIVCEISEHMPDEAAIEIAEALNMHMEKFPENH